MEKGDAAQAVEDVEQRPKRTSVLLESAASLLLGWSVPANLKLSLKPLAAWVAPHRVSKRFLRTAALFMLITTKGVKVSQKTSFLDDNSKSECGGLVVGDEVHVKEEFGSAAPPSHSLPKVSTVISVLCDQGRGLVNVFQS